MQRGRGSNMIGTMEVVAADDYQSWFDGQTYAALKAIGRSPSTCTLRENSSTQLGFRLTCMRNPNSLHT
jgi:hypothetical protein